MIFDKELNLSEEDISNSTNIEQLSNWKNSLSSKLTSILNRYEVNGWQELPIKAKTAYRYSFSLYKSCGRRLAFLYEQSKSASGYVSEKDKRKNRALCNKFMEVAKRELPKDLYERILQIAQQENG